MACSTTEVDICRFRGDTDSFTVSLVKEDGTPVDLTGSSVDLTVDISPAPVDNTNNLFTLVGVLTATPTDGIVTFTLTTLQADQTPSTYFYDTQWTAAGGAITTVLTGEWQVVQDITK